MFKPAKIFHTRTFLPEDKVSDLVIKLHEKGISELKKSDANLETTFEYIDIKKIDETSKKVSVLLELLDDYKELKQVGNVFLEMIFPKDPEKFKVDLLSDDEIISEANRHLEVVEPKILSLKQEIDSLNEKVSQNKGIIQNLSILPQIETEVFSETNNFKIFVGLMDQKGIEKVKAYLKKHTVFGFEEKTKEYLAIVLCLKKDALETEKELHDSGFVSIDFPKENATPKRLISNLEEENKNINSRLIEIEKEMKSTWKKYNNRLLILEEELEIARQRIESANLFRSSTSFVVLEAWVPAKKFSEFKKTIELVTKNYYLEKEERNDAPIILENPSFIAPFEMITELYGLPKYNSLDPTPLVAFTFPFFYGFMLGDFVYGILMTLLCYFVMIGIGRQNPGMKRFGKAFFIIGIFTTMMGVIFGSYFGDFFPKIGIQLPGVLDAMQDILILIILSLVIGAIHLVSGLLFGLIENIMKKDFFAAAKDQLVWLLFFFGLIMAALPQTQIIGFALLLIAVILQIVTNLLEGGPAVAILSPMNFPGFIGDLFSYARLAAMAVGTAGIALAVNFMTLLVIKLIPVVGIFIAIPVFLGGHLFNFGMNALGSFIHTLRLHFLEYFSKFYSGGGKKYKPFYAYRIRNYMEVD